MTSASTFSEKEPFDAEQRGMKEPTAGATTTDESETLPEKAPPRLEDDSILHGRKPADGEVVALFSQLSLKQITTHSSSDLHREVGGVLLGYAYHYDGVLFLDVRAAIPAVTADHGPVHFTFTADAWAQLHKDRTQRYPDLDIVGWFHTHPDLGVFYSSDDVVVHSAAFVMPWHIGLVVDPVREECALFGWQNEQLAPISGFYERMELDPSSVLVWRVVPAEIWDHSYEYRDDSYRGGGVYLPTSSPPAIPAMKTYVGYGLAAIGLLLSLLILGAWVLPLTREVDRLQNMVVVLADSALAESNAGLCPDPRLRILSPLDGQRLEREARVEAMGTIMLPDVSRYQVDARPAGAEQRWAVIDTHRGSTKLGEIASWDVSAWPAGVYDLRLSAVDSNNIRIPTAPNCAISIEIAP
jgi:proteasome lid subunit RPN8/RPN11